ncbi:hypothetical protein ACHAXR_011330 [Thalassiosira sp. AJA248-18]
MDYRKRPRLEDHGAPSNSKPQSTLAIPSSSSSTSPTIKLLQTELRTLRAELDHSQSIRSIERKNADRSETRLKRQLADSYEEITQKQELVESLREQVDLHGQTMEESRQEWLERIQWYEEQWEEMANNNADGGGGESGDSGSRHECDLLQKRLDAAMDQVRELEQSLEESEERRGAAEGRAADAEKKFAEANQYDGSAAVNENNKAEIPRDLRIKVAETERANRELQRQNESMKSRVQDMIQHKERAASSQRRVLQLEKELQHVTRQMEEGMEAHRRWMKFRNEIVEEGLVGENDEMITADEGGVPPEIATVVRKFQSFKRKTKLQEDEIARVTQLAEAHLRRCKVLETQLNEKSQSVSLLDKTVKAQEATINQLELENRKIVSQQNIWKRESEGMRSLLDTYEQQETKSPMSKRTNADGLQLSLNSAREEVKLLSETNDKLELTIEELRNEQQTAKAEHDRVLEKFGKLRNALMEERAKAEAAEGRACQAETLAGKGSYNDETTRVLHLKSNPLMDAVREKYQGEIESLERRLEEAEAAASAPGGGGGTTTPVPSKGSSRGSFGSAGSRDSVDVQKLHSRLKEQFRNQIALFRQGVYLITGFKIDMSQGESDCQIFTVRSLYGEREDDHLKFKWSPKKKNKLDMLNTDMAHLLMKGASGVYVKEHGSWPGFMASVTLQLFDQQTLL